jgi:Transglutaminase-like superfamily/Bacterial transglutaminase-like N-terminal region
MRLHIHHTTRYTYDDSVFLEPHYLNFCPQHRPYLQVEEFNLWVNPTPDGLFPLLNIENALQYQCWFNRTVKSLEIIASIKVHTTEFNPFGFFIDMDVLQMNIQEHFGYLSIDQPISSEMEAVLLPYVSVSPNDLLTPVNEILQLINQNWDHTVRYAEDIHEPSDCFQRKNGSCRDLSWMMIVMLRYLKIPARFVGGYAFNPELGEGHELHAWVEFMAPGAGWIGVDPSAGIFTNEAYIPIAANKDPKKTLPVLGSYRGSVSSRLETKVKITEF